MPDIGAGLRTRIGSSVLEEFVAGHGPADVLREVVQNEFDGGGRELRIEFGEDCLTVTGSGRPIGRPGWKRLDVIMGTGAVLGDDDGEVVEAKQNGIGSKNFGMRSLFLFGERIYVRSNGRVAILDCAAMATGQQADPESSARSGVTLHVPYRVARRRALQPFTTEREASAFDEFAEVLMPTLLKLALGGRRSGLTRVEITSTRLRRRLIWRQRAERTTCKLTGVAALRRTGRFSDERDGEERMAPVNVDEIEYSRVVPVPPEHASESFAGYFRTPKGVRICVSLPMKRNRLAVGAAGHFHYPLRARHGRTGCAASVSAPFRMDPDRTHVLDNDWNRWLCDGAAELVGDLLVSEWLERFGADGYVALRDQGTAEPKAFRERVTADLLARKCWPTRASGEETRFAEASSLVMPVDPLLDGFLSPRRYLDARLASDPAAAALAASHGALPFTVNSLVRLRWVPKDLKDAASPIRNGEANYHFNSFPAAVGVVADQVRAANVLTKLQRHLSNENRRDMCEMPATLTASGELRPAGRLITVRGDIWDVCPVPMARRLHRELNDHVAVSRNCEPFDLGRWMADAAERSANGNADAAEREALYARILDAGVKLPAALAAILRRCPVVKDSSGDWTSPEALAILPRADAALLSGVVRAPAPEIMRDARLVRRLRIRHAVGADDILGLAARTVTDADAPAALERLATRHPALLTARVVERLRTVPFLPSRSGGRRAPGELHMPTSANLGCLGADDIAASPAHPLLRILGCREHPASATLLARLERARAEGKPFDGAGHLYPALVDAIRRERIPLGQLAERPILVVEDRFVSPRECLVLAQPVRCLQAAVPFVAGTAATAEAYRALGASATPRDHHWVAVFERFDRLSRADSAGRLAAVEIGPLRDAYRRRSGAGCLPDGLPTGIRCLLSRAGTLYSPDDARAGRFLEDDHPQLAEALLAVGAPLAFADGSEQSRSFFHGMGLRRLSEVAGVPTVRLGKPSPAPGWFRPVHGHDLVALLRSDPFATAVVELAHAHRRTVAEFRPARETAIRQRLDAIVKVSFVSGIQQTFRLGRARASIPAEAALEEDGIAMLPPRNLLAFEYVVATALAEVAGASRLRDVRALSALIATPLRCRSRDDLDAFLLRQGIRARFRDQADLPLETAADAETGGTPADAIVRNLVAGLDLGAGVNLGGRAAETASPAATAAAVGATGAAAEPQRPAVPPTLPPLADVTVRVAAPTGTPAPELRTGGTGGASPGPAWRPPSAADVERDRMMGRRGEELVLAMEIERLRRLGHERPEERVAWVSRDAPGSDHDIRSVADDGGVLYIEVKSTTGTDGRFEWSRNEFERAMREGSRYQLWRVYEVDTATPTAKAFGDPATLLAAGTLRIELSGLRASVEAMS